MRIHLLADCLELFGAEVMVARHVCRLNFNGHAVNAQVNIIIFLMSTFTHLFVLFD